MDLRPRVAYTLPDGLRAELAEPFGPVARTEEVADAVRGAQVLAVGDVVSLTLKRAGIEPRVFVCDYATQRGQPESAFEEELGNWGEVAFRVRNPAGTIQRAAWDAIVLAIEHGKGPVRILVEGEEDLLGIPCFLEAPTGAKVLYGMPGQGVVVVDVTPQLKEKVRKIVQRMRQE